MKHPLYVLLLLSGGIIFGQSKIDNSKKELNEGTGSKPPLTSASAISNGSGNSSKNSVSGDECGLFLKICGYIVFGAFKYGVVGDYKNEEHLDNNLTDYPYYNKESGNYENYSAEDANLSKKDFRLDIEDKLLFSNKDLYGNHLNVKIRPFHYFFVQTDYHQLFEKNQMTSSTDKLSLFYFNLGYDRIRFENFNLGWTVGASYVGNEVKKGGFSVGITTEYFFPKNISFLGSAKWSSINGKPVTLFELEGKYHIKKCFVTLGFEHLRIASPNYNFVSFGGGIYLN